jgi:hypothetical protein
MTDGQPPPSTREQRVDELIAQYLEAVAAGQALDRQALLAAHPDLAAFVTDHDGVKRLAEPLRAPGPVAPGETPTIDANQTLATAFPPSAGHYVENGSPCIPSRHENWSQKGQE